MEAINYVDKEGNPIDVDVEVIYDEVEIEDMEYEEETGKYYYPCPCGDRFVIHEDELLAGEDIARCPSCSLLIRVIYDLEEED